MNPTNPIVLVTGTAGFIGLHVTKRLLEDGKEVIGLDNLNDYYDGRRTFARSSKTRSIHRKGG